MGIDLKVKHENFYTPLWEKFLKDIEGENVQNCPESHLPVYGGNYSNSEYKIIFIGIDSKGLSKMAEYTGENSYQRLMEDWREELCSLVYKEWGTNSIFWRFIFEFLSKFYDVDIEQLRKSKKESKLLESILNSFVWANVNSIEGFNVTAKEKNVEYERWKKVKDASLIFDKLEHILNIFQPNVVILLNWNAPENWFPADLGEPEKNPTIPLWSYLTKNQETYIFWTKHPRALIKTGFNDIIFEILEFIEKRRIFSSFPGIRLLEENRKKRAKITQLLCELENIANDLHLKIKFDEAYTFEKVNSGFWLYKSEWEYCIYFYFGDKDALYLSIANVNDSNPCDSDMIAKLEREFGKKWYSPQPRIELGEMEIWRSTDFSKKSDILPKVIKEECEKILFKLKNININ